MRKLGYFVTGLTVFAGALLAFGGIKEAAAEVSVNINIGPPPIVVAEPPEVVLIPGSQVYFVPGLEFDVFFYNGYWWSPRGERWYRSRAYNGPWRGVGRRYIPGPLFRVPGDYRTVYVRERRIPYGQWKKQRKHRGRGEDGDWREDGGGNGRGRGHRED